MNNIAKSTARVWSVALLTCLAVVLTSVTAAQSAHPADKSANVISAAALMQPEALAQQLKSKAEKPVVLYVGPRFLYAQAHVPGAEFIGPASDPQSMEQLKKRVAALPKNAAIVVYCGCCPWDHCPNIRPAYSELQKLGFKNVKALDLPTSFGTNWVDKGYPVEKGEAGAAAK